MAGILDRQSQTHSVTEGGMTQTYRKLCDKPTVDAVEVIVESIEVIVVVNGIDIVVSVDTLTVRRAVEVEAVTVTVNGRRWRMVVAGEW